MIRESPPLKEGQEVRHISSGVIHPFSVGVVYTVSGCDLHSGRWYVGIEGFNDGYAVHAAERFEAIH